jgi:HK97 family phage major capsid protein
MDRQDLGSLGSVSELQEYQKEIRARVAQIHSERGVQPPSEEEREELGWLVEDEEEIEARVKDYQGREKLVRSFGDDEDRRESGFGFRPPSSKEKARNENVYDLSTVRMNLTDPNGYGQELRERAKTAIEEAEFDNPIISNERAKESVAKLLRKDAADGRFARYLLATGSPTYKRAWMKALMPNGQGLMTREESLAMQSAALAERALNLTGASGGFAVPFELDPTILLTSNGVVNPVRQVANVKSITVDEWRGITSAGVTAAYAAEATETTDNAPTLAQPTISTERAQAFIPFSIEIDMDWGGLREEMSQLLQDAKDVLEAAKFINGTGTNEPFGVIVGATNTVAAATGQTFTLANLYALRAALPPRYRPRGVFMGDLLIADRIRQFDTVGSPASVWQEGLQEDNPARILGRPYYEASEMADTPATGNKFLLYGDFSRYVIADRIGLNVELVPHLLGANRRPTGERGLFAYWRNGAKVIDANAFRVLLGTA